MTNSLEPSVHEFEDLSVLGYTIGLKIGQGSFASVHLADYEHPETKQSHLLACKIIDCVNLPQDILHKGIPRELEILQKLQHPHVIEVHSILQQGSRVFIFMRFAENGNLLNFLNMNGPLIEQNAKHWFRQMISGLEYLHSKEIAHQDLKCENILLSLRYNVKLADFGFSRFCLDKDGRRVLTVTYCGSAAYAAPEVVSGTPHDPKQADVWSVGVILYIMLNASMPFDASNLKQQLKQQISKNWTFNSKLICTLSESVKSLVREILEPDMAKRSTLDSILNHDWIEGKTCGSSTSTRRSWSTGGREVARSNSADGHFPEDK